jgi:D-arabinose 1-dehydrogenase-like Zn-dependent alcohol dehydrogenase
LSCLLTPSFLKILRWLKGGKYYSGNCNRRTTVNLHQTYLRHLSLLGLYLGEKYELEELVKLVSDGKVKPHIGHRLEMKDAAKGHQLIAEGKVIGKVVLII